MKGLARIFCCATRAGGIAVPVSGGEVFSVQSRSGVSPVPRGEKTGKKKRGYQSALPNNTKEK
jgi:hypothetical protein